MTALFSHREFNRALRRTLLLPLVLIALCPVVLVLFGRQLVDVIRWDRHSVEVIATAYGVEKLLVDLETGLRGFQLTGDESFLEPYNRGAPLLESSFEAWENQVADNAAQRQQVKLVRRDHEVWNAFAVEALRRTRERQAVDPAFNASGKALMDRTRADMAVFIGAEQELLARRSALVEPVTESAVKWMLVAFVVAGFGTAYWVARQMRVLAHTYGESLDAIDQEKESFRVTLSSIGDAVIVTDRDGRVTFVNAEAERLTGWEWREARGRTLKAVFRIVNEETRETVDDPVEKVFRENRVVGLANHTALISRSGVEWLIEDSAAPIYDREKKIVGVVLVFQDASERRRAQKELRRAHEEAIAAAQAKDNFLAALSHELRTPLNPVLLLATEAAANPALPAEIRADFDTISKNVMLEARLIDDLLDLTRITRGKMSFDMQLVDVRQILEEAVAKVQAEIEAKALSIGVDLGREACVVRGDEARLQQVFWNVLRNAVKFTPVGGRVRLTVRRAAAGDTVAIAISDSGIGMTQAELERAFEYFAQGDHAVGSGAHRFGGLGLGLAISRMLVESHAGSIVAESAGPDRGSTVTVTLPLANTSGPGGAVAPSVSAAVENAMASRRILVVEDHTPTRDALAQLLIKRNYAVIVAGSVAEALAAIEAQRVELVISDIGLPDGDGYELMSTLRERLGVTGIALTGYGMEADVVRSQAAGFVTHLTKPVSVQTLETALATVRFTERVGE